MAAWRDAMVVGGGLRHEPPIKKRLDGAVGEFMGQYPVTRGLAALIAGSVLCLIPAAGSAAAPEASPLLAAARDDLSSRVADLLQQRANVNVRDELGATPLAWAVLRNNVDMVTRLLAAGADPNLVDVNGVGPLALAVESDAVEIARLLLEKKADPNPARSNGETPLMSAVRLRSPAMVQLLLDHGAQANVAEKKFGQSALMWAAGEPAIVRMLLQKGADVRAVTKTWEVTATRYTPITNTLGLTGIPWNHDGEYTTKAGGLGPLHFAVQNGDAESVKMLLDAGADVNQATADGTTPLLTALFKWTRNGRQTRITSGGIVGSPDLTYVSDLKLAGLLLDRGAKADVASELGYTPLHGAALGLVLSQPQGISGLAFNPKRNDPNRPRPKGPAEEAEYVALIQRLLESGADPNRKTRFPAQGPVNAVRTDPTPPGSTPFHIAAAAHSAKLVTLMAKHRADPNLVRDDGHTPFSVAVMGNDLPVVEAMVASGANIRQVFDTTDEIADPVEAKTQQRKGQSILHIAGMAGSDWVIPFLTARGAPLNLRNSLGETPFDIADAQERYRYARQAEGRTPAEMEGVKRETQTSSALQVKTRMAAASSR
jgi:ankyrin